MVDVKYERMMKKYIPLSRLKALHQQHKTSGGPLRNLALFTKARLSVQPISEGKTHPYLILIMPMLFVLKMSAFYACCIYSVTYIRATWNSIFQPDRYVGACVKLLTPGAPFIHIRKMATLPWENAAFIWTLKRVLLCKYRSLLYLDNKISEIFANDMFLQC